MWSGVFWGAVGWVGMLWCVVGWCGVFLRAYCEIISFHCVCFGVALCC